MAETSRKLETAADYLDATFDHMNETFDRIEKHFDELSDKMYEKLDKECEHACNCKVVIKREPNIWLQRIIIVLFGSLVGFLLGKFVF